MLNIVPGLPLILREAKCLVIYGASLKPVIWVPIFLTAPIPGILLPLPASGINMYLLVLKPARYMPGSGLMSLACRLAVIVVSYTVPG